jgi:long-chain acyl-CoA synthetase
MLPRTVFSVLEEAARWLGDTPALHQPSTVGGQRTYRSYSWKEYKQVVVEIASGLRRMGIRKGDIIALASETRAEFYLADLGIMANGSISAALYTSYPVPDLIRTLRVCAAKAIFVEDPKTLRRLRPAADPPLEVLWILLIGEADGTLTLEQLRQQGRSALNEDPGFFARLQAEVTPSDDAILYLTSGATGEPKMALASHGALVANMDMGPVVLQTTPEECTLAFLPSAHITQRVVIELIPISCGFPVWFSESLLKLPEELQSVKPTLFIAPPRLWERVYTSIHCDLAKRSTFAQKLFKAALNLGLAAVSRRQDGKPLPFWMSAALKLTDRLVFRKVCARFGGHMRICASGSAPLGAELARFYRAMGLPLLEGYGLTEGGVVVMNPLDRPRAGSIGTPLPGVEVRLADDGELLVRSPTLFSGYFQDPEATAQVLRDGWLHTGDTAEIDRDGYLYITGRKKELIITSSGKKIFPSRIENLFRIEPIVSNVLLVGDRLPYLGALLTVNASVAESLKGMESLRGRPPAEVVTAAPVLNEVQGAVRRVNRNLAQFEQIRKFRILERDFTIDQGELTATLKVRRTRALQNFHDAVKELYAGRDHSA